ncbi:MAG: hypothetical protein MRY21_05080 [Simkaniaceae bacterium]|nr:hypothetical protein [Simkaniaceae bacterium]
MVYLVFTFLCFLYFLFKLWRKGDNRGLNGFSAGVFLVVFLIQLAPFIVGVAKGFLR